MCENLNLRVVEIEIDAKPMFGWISRSVVVVYIIFLLSWIARHSSAKFLK